MPLQKDNAAISTVSFSARLLSWYDQHGRKNLPWQQDINPYKVWISEIMLQQTQVSTVIPYFNQFMASFPTVADLAKANEDEVLHHWSGLGYYSRARNLHKSAKQICSEHNGDLPNDLEQLQALPGIGPSTAGAIRATAFELPATILDGNVKRVLARHNAIAGWPGQTTTNKKLWQIAEAYTPAKHLRAYTQAIMDLGATLCTRSKPNCEQCPVQTSCIAFKEQSIAEFPGKKPRKALPVKTIQMLIMQNAAGEVLLEKRPPVGIWGGLWSFPEADDITKTFCLSNKINDKKVGDVVRHTFSHFHLDITPVFCKLQTNIKDASTTNDAIINKDFIGVMDDKPLLWYNIAEPRNVGLAAPVAKLLSTLPSI